MAFRTAAPRRAGARILGTLAALLAAALATGQPGLVLAATPIKHVTATAGWLGGTKTSAAELTVQFTGASGRILTTAAIGPAGKQAKPVPDYRHAAGTVPAGATRARVTITLTTTLTDWNGPDAPQTGYNYATAADISLSLNQPAPLLRPGHRQHQAGAIPEQPQGPWRDPDELLRGRAPERR